MSASEPPIEVELADGQEQVLLRLAEHLMTEAGQLARFSGGAYVALAVAAACAKRSIELGGAADQRTLRILEAALEQIQATAIKQCELASLGAGPSKGNA